MVCICLFLDKHTFYEASHEQFGFDCCVWLNKKRTHISAEIWIDLLFIPWPGICIYIFKPCPFVTNAIQSKQTPNYFNLYLLTWYCRYYGKNSFQSLTLFTSISTQQEVWKSYGKPTSNEYMKLSYRILYKLDLNENIFPIQNIIHKIAVIVVLHNCW